MGKKSAIIWAARRPPTWSAQRPSSPKAWLVDMGPHHNCLGQLFLGYQFRGFLGLIPIKVIDIMFHRAGEHFLVPIEKEKIGIEERRSFDWDFLDH